MVAMTASDAIGAAGTIIVKIGSSLLVDEDRNAVNADWLASIARDIATLREQGKNVVVVSSGAIALEAAAWASAGGRLPSRKSRPPPPPDR